MAGQTVPHFHIHIIPRKKGDWANNDDIYPEIDKKAKDLVNALKETETEKKAGPDAEERPPRTQEEMAKEAVLLRGFFKQSENIWDE
jgi:bis(5'-adenosyl)-triphosphatase